MIKTLPIYTSVSGFTQAVDTAKRREALTELLASLRHNDVNFRDGSPDYIECWKAVMARGRRLNYTYCRTRKAFF